ncbi:MAG: DMT family transporter [Alphaproteobacteria bacterium]|nr:DMT family transporter [Alphaproteobacteria bacterium]
MNASSRRSFAPPGERWALPALLLGAVGIAFSPIFVRLSELGPTATAFHRVFLAIPALALWLLLENRRRADPARLPARAAAMPLALAGLFFAGDLAAWHWSIAFTSVANATLLANFAPVAVTLGAWLLFGQRPSATFVAGLALALFGAAILMGESVALSADHLFGDGLGLLTAAFYAGYLLAVGRLRARLSTATIMTWSGIATAIVLLPIVWISGESLIPETGRGLAVLLGLALVSQAGGQSLIAYGLAHLPAAFGSVVLLLQPVLAAILAWAILAEPLSAVQGLGGVVVLAGILLARRGGR